MRIIRIFDVYESVAMLMNPVLHLMEMMIIKELPTDVRKFPGVQKVDDFGDLLRLCIYCSSIIPALLFSSRFSFLILL